ncbi:hypothetical protein MY10362_004718 [Beauveria mimosiformis]
MNEKLPISEIGALTYPRLNLNHHTLDDNLPELPLGQEYVALKPPRGGAGTLGCLPTEILQETLFQLDLQTLTDFRLETTIRDSRGCEAESFLEARYRIINVWRSLNRGPAESCPLAFASSRSVDDDDVVAVQHRCPMWAANNLAI